jgi:hypothetical protein
MTTVGWRRAGARGMAGPGQSAVMAFEKGDSRLFGSGILQFTRCIQLPMIVAIRLLK